MIACASPVPYLSFGATAAVYAFNRISKALSAIMKDLFALPNESYFDDFTFLDFVATAKRDSLPDEVCDLLGFTVKDVSDEKNFRAVFESLGAEYDFS